MKSSMGWYKGGRQGDHFYTPFTASKREFMYAGDGTKAPTPKEMVEFLEAHPDAWVGNSSKLFECYITDKSPMKEVTVPNGSYFYRAGGGGVPDRLVPFTLRQEDFVNCNTMFDNVINDITKFISSEDIYKANGLFFKLGILMYGAPGAGKSLIIRKIISEIVDNSLAIFFERDFPSEEMLVKIEETMGNRIKIFVIEELASDIREDWYVKRLLTFLDGEMSVRKSIILATTNYPEQLPANIVDRPSRFDRLYKFDNPSIAAKKMLLEKFLGREVIEAELEGSKDFSIADIKEAAVCVLVNKMTLAQAIKGLKDRKALCKRAFAAPRSTGFGFSGEDEDGPELTFRRM